MLVHLIADYGAGDLAFAEVTQRLALALPAPQVHATPVAPFDTLGAGFCVAQLALTEGPSDRLVIHNVAPRWDEPGPRPANEGERFCAGRTTGGVLIVGPNSGFSFSFCAPELESLRYLAVAAAGSQFRSRDLLPPVLPALLAGDTDVIKDCVPRERVPEPPESVIAYVDGYGNLKTTINDAPAAPGARVLVRIGSVSATAVVADGTFAVAEGELALAPGSSGWTSHTGQRRAFYELFLRGRSAANRFVDPSPGTPVCVEGSDAARCDAHSGPGVMSAKSLAALVPDLSPVGEVHHRRVDEPIRATTPERRRMSDIVEQAKSRVLDRIESPRDFLEFKLGAALKMERRVLGMLGKLEDKARSDAVKQQLRHHAEETRGQIENIEQSFSALGHKADEKPCPTIEALEKEGKANVKLANDQMCDLIILSGAAETEHHEIAVYETVIKLAEHQGQDEIVRRLRENLEQEEHTLEKVKQATREMLSAAQNR